MARRGRALLWAFAAFAAFAAALHAAVLVTPAAAAALPRPDEDSASASALLVVTSTSATPASSTGTGTGTEAGQADADEATESATESAPWSAPSKAQQATGPQVRSLHVLSEVQYRYAHTVVSSRVANPANTSKEVTFSVVLPETAFISSFLMEVDGKVYKAYVKEKEEAKKTYEQAVAAGQSAAHVAVSARDSNSFTVSLNVESQNKVSFNLTYEELLSRKLGMYEHVITLNPGQVVKDMEVRVHIKENKDIINLRVPEFTSGNKIDADIQTCDDTTACAYANQMATITWKSKNDVEVVFRPSADDQKEIMGKLDTKRKQREQEEASRLNLRRWSDVFDPSQTGAGVKADGLNGQFSVLYDVARAADGGEVVVNDGYFVHFFSPAELQPLKKHAVFVLDVSGSMDGRKIEQLREAMTAILGDLREGDFFNLIAFSSEVKVLNLDSPEKSAIIRSTSGYVTGTATPAGPPAERAERPPAYPATKENIAKAKELVKQMSAYGGTNIYDALKTAIEVARDGTQSTAGSAQPVEPIILFLTDGDPTVGVTMLSRITSGVSELNLKPRSAIFSLAFGEGADVKFLRKVSLANGGFARTIYEAADASLQLNNFYKQISSPLLANVTFQYIPDKVERDSMTKLDFRTFFDGSELVVAGRTSDKSIAEVGGTVQAVGDDGKPATFRPHLIPIDEPISLHPGPLFNRSEPHEATVLERLWAYLTIKQLLDDQDALDAANADKDETITPTRVRPPQPPPPPPMALPAQGLVEAVPAPTDTTTTASASATETALDLSVLKPEPKKRALELALKYSFVTPLTSLVVVKPNETRATDAQSINPGDASSAAAGLGTGDRFGAYHISAAGAALPGSSALGLQGPSMAFSATYMLPMPMMSHQLRPRPRPAHSASQQSWAEASVDQLQTDEHDPVSHALTTTYAPSLMTNISEVKWLPEDALQKGSAVLRLDGNGAEKTFKIATNETDPEHPSPCQINDAALTQGVCRHLTNCVLKQVVERIEDFAKYQCNLGDYLAICCPPDAGPLKLLST